MKLDTDQQNQITNFFIKIADAFSLEIQDDNSIFGSTRIFSAAMIAQSINNQTQSATYNSISKTGFPGLASTSGSGTTSSKPPAPKKTKSKTDFIKKMLEDMKKYPDDNTDW